MRRGLWIGVALLVIAAGILIGVGAYHAGVNDGIEQAANSEQIVRVVGGRSFARITADHGRTAPPTMNASASHNDTW